MRPLLTCRELIDFIVDYLDGTLTSDERADFDAHLAVCPHCVDYLDEYRATVEAGRASYLDREGPVPDEVPADLVAVVLAVRRGR